MKKRTGLLLTVCFLILLLSFLGYFLLAFYYRDVFCLNTWINGVYCTGRTVEEVNAELKAGMKPPVVIVTDKNGDSMSLDLGQMDYRADFLPALQEYRKDQNPFLWVDHIFLHGNYAVTPEISFDEKKLKDAFDAAELIRKETERLKEYRLVQNETDGYFLYDGLHDRLDTEKAFEKLLGAVRDGSYQINLAEEECYYDIPLTKEQEQTKQLWEKVEDFQSCGLIYDMGDEELPMDASVLADFLVAQNGIPQTDEDGSLMLDTKKVKEFVTSLAEEYDTYGSERRFQSTRGDLVTVKGGTYGNKLDQKKETDYLTEHLKIHHLDQSEEKGSHAQDHLPFYEKEALIRGKDDLGDTYIEIDMTEQKMYYYEAGKLMLETEVVTGNTGRKMGTPEGVNFVYNKQTDRVLRGPGYASPVKYWMPVKGNIGIHDASWRSKFGGTIYQTNGSHGCINTPTAKMAELYEMAEIGTPVVMFY